MSYSPLTGFAYVNTIAIGMVYEPEPIETIKNLKPGQPHYGVKRQNLFPDPEPRGYLKAIDPLTGKSKWETGFKSPNWAGTLVTAGGLVFTGTLTGEFIAVDVDTGKLLWQRDLGKREVHRAGRVVEHAQSRDLQRERVGVALVIVDRHADEDQQAAFDGAEDLVLDGDRCLGDALHDCAHQRPLRRSSISVSALEMRSTAAARYGAATASCACTHDAGSASNTSTPPSGSRAQSSPT